MAKAQRKEIHEGLPIVERALILNNTGAGLTKSVGIAPRECVPDETVGFAGKMHHVKTTFENLYDKEGQLEGFRQIDVYSALGVIVTDDAGDAVDEMIRRIADREDETRAAKAGQVRLPVAEAEKRAAGDLAKRVDEAMGSVSEIRPGIVDDEGLSE